MTLLQRTIAGVVAFLLVVFVIDLVRRRKLREEYSLLWLASLGVMIIVALFGQTLDWLAKLLGIQHAAYAIFVVAIVLGMGLAVHFTVVLSKLTAQNWRLAQEIALLRCEFDEHLAAEHGEHKVAEAGSQTD